MWKIELTAFRRCLKDEWYFVAKCFFLAGGEGASEAEGLNDINLSSCVFWNMIYLCPLT